MSAVRAQHNSLCPECKNPIQKGDAIVVVDDKWMHVECECDFRPWEETVRAFLDWKSVAFEHDDVYYGLPMDQTEAALIGALLGQEIAKAAPRAFDVTDPDVTSTLGFGLMIGMALERYRSR